MNLSKEYFIKIGFSEENAQRSLFLYDIAKAVSAKDLVLKGGTSLLFGYGLNRYSTDLDFNTTKRINHISNIIEILRKKNIRYSTIHDRKEGSRIITDILFKNGKRRDKLKIDIDYSGKYMNNEQNIIHNNGIYMFSANILCRMKYEAFLDRKKARDIFDIGYLLQHSPKSFNMNMLENIDRRIKDLGTDTIKKIFMKDDVLKFYNVNEIVDKTILNVNILLNNFKEKRNNNQITGQTVEKTVPPVSKLITTPSAEQDSLNTAEKPGKKKKDPDYGYER